MGDDANFGYEVYHNSSSALGAPGFGIDLFADDPNGDPVVSVFVMDRNVIQSPGAKIDM